MNVMHLSAECYPVAKVGGLGDVVGALPLADLLAALLDEGAQASREGSG